LPSQKKKGGKIMKNKLFALMLGIFLITTGIISASDTDIMSVSVNVTSSEVGINVPEFVQFENIAAGYISERHDVLISNTGTTDITITAELINYSDYIFSNLVFQDVLTDPMQRIDQFSIDLLKPTKIGGTRGNTIYMYLDLQEYNEQISDIIFNHQADILFSAVPLI
jgi:hypothetical protein